MEADRHPREPSLIARVKAQMDADAKMRSRGIRTQEMKDYDAQRNFLNRILPRRQLGITLEELLARWAREYGDRPSGGLTEMLTLDVSAGIAVRSGKGTRDDPHRYRRR